VSLSVEETLTQDEKTSPATVSDPRRSLVMTLRRRIKRFAYSSEFTGKEKFWSQNEFSRQGHDAGAWVALDAWTRASIENNETEHRFSLIPNQSSKIYLDGYSEYLMTGGVEW